LEGKDLVSDCDEGWEFFYTHRILGVVEEHDKDTICSFRIQLGYEP
jgi:hypothetical protein